MRNYRAAYEYTTTLPIPCESAVAAKRTTDAHASRGLVPHARRSWGCGISSLHVRVIPSSSKGAYLREYNRLGSIGANQIDRSSRRIQRVFSFNLNTVVRTFASEATLFHGRSFSSTQLEQSLVAAHVRLSPVVSPAQPPDVDDVPTVLLVDRSLPGCMNSLEQLPNHVVVVAGDAAAEEALSDAADLSLTTTSNVEGSLRVLRTAFELSAARLNAAQPQRELESARIALAALNRTGMALMAERDHDVLLEQIILAARRITHSDAGVLYLIEEQADGGTRIRFKLAHAESVPDVPGIQDISYAIDSTSMAGHVAITRQPLVIDDVYNLPQDAEYQMNPLLPRLANYPIRSLLTIPMVDHRDRVVGVLQLANRKNDAAARIHSQEDLDRYVIPFSNHDVEIGYSLAGQAAVSIENANLHAQVENLCESFTRAAVTAVDQRDPATAGHSIRTANLVMDLAHALEQSRAGPYRDLHFTRAQIRELRFAALLHDFGKVGVREDVLTKSKKLPAFLWERVTARFDLIRCALELEYERKRAHMMALHDSHRALAALAADFDGRRKQIDQFETAVRSANEPAGFPVPPDGILTDVAKQKFERPDGRVVPYLTTDELHYLQITSGTLDERERLEVQSHAKETFIFLSQIPWTDDLKRMAIFAGGHHEKLDGTGYPLGLAAQSIPVQTRLITVADIFDALTESNRPYKCAVSAEKALDILKAEANAGCIDADIVQVLIESQVYRRVPKQGAL